MDYRYDAASNLIEAVDGVPQGCEYLAPHNPDVIRTRYQRDVLGQLVGKFSSKPRTGSAVQSIIQRERFQYDALGQLTTMRYGSGHVYQLNLDQQVLSEFERDALYQEVSRTQGALHTRYQWDNLQTLTLG